MGWEVVIDEWQRNHRPRLELSHQGQCQRWPGLVKRAGSYSSGHLDYFIDLAWRASYAPDLWRGNQGLRFRIEQRSGVRAIAERRPESADSMGAAHSGDIRPGDTVGRTGQPGADIDHLPDPEY